MFKLEINVYNFIIFCGIHTKVASYTWEGSKDGTFETHWNFDGRTLEEMHPMFFEGSSLETYWSFDGRALGVLWK